MGKLRAWWHLLTSVGPGLRAGRQSDTMFRYYVHQSLADIGLFRVPRRTSDLRRDPRPVRLHGQ